MNVDADVRWAEPVDRFRSAHAQRCVGGLWAVECMLWQASSGGHAVIRAHPCG